MLAILMSIFFQKSVFSLISGCCSDLSEPSGSSAGEELRDEIENDDDEDEDIIDLSVDDAPPETTGKTTVARYFLLTTHYATCNACLLSVLQHPPHMVARLLRTHQGSSTPW